MNSTHTISATQLDRVRHQFRTDKEYAHTVRALAKEEASLPKKQPVISGGRFLSASLTLTSKLGGVLYGLGSYESFLNATDGTWYWDKPGGHWVKNVEVEIAKIWIMGSSTPLAGLASPILASNDPDISRWDFEGSRGLDYFNFGMIQPNAEAELEPGDFLFIGRTALAAVQRLRITVPLDPPVQEVEPGLPHAIPIPGSG